MTRCKTSSLVANGAAVPIDSGYFGGETSQSFTYDNLYQLTDAQGSWTTRQGHEHRYNLAMNYDTIGNIKAKNQNHERLPYKGDKWIAQKATTYDWTYEHTLKQPHAPSKIGNRTFTYDLNGNQTGWQDTQKNNKRVIHWDEENRIRHIIDNGHSNFYIYDAGGERTLKRTAQGETFYVNAYFVIRNGTVASKHFFAGSQRVATKLTKQESQTIVTPPAGTVTQEEIDQAELRVAQAQTRVDEAQAVYDAAKGQDKKVAKDALDEAELSLQTAQDALTALLEAQNQTDTGTETTATKDVNIIYEHQQYYYHPDHLGSSSFVTDQTGKVYEHLEYFPFGETFAHEHSNTQRTPYRFTGKEYDEVTGLYYYGARYYDPRTSVWQSPDPIIGEYMSGQTNGGVFNPKNMNMFGYTYNNPVNLVDPDGNAVDPRLKITGAAAMYDSDVTSHNYSVEETDAAFETMGMVLGLGGLVKHFAGDAIKSAGKSIVNKIKQVFGKKARKETDSKGNIISREPKTIQDKMVLDAAKKGAGNKILDSKQIGDKKFPNHDKYQYTEKSNEGVSSTIHYMKDKETGKLSDFKFMNHGADGKTQNIPRYEKVK